MTAEVERLRDRVAELERIMGLDNKLPLRVLLQPRSWVSECAPLCGLLMAREFVGRETAFVALYGSRPEASQPEIKIIDSLIFRLRRALEPYQVTISTAFGLGYYMTMANKQRFEALIERLRVERA